MRKNYPHKQEKNRYSCEDIVYFHCFSKKLPEARFFCKGIITRVPEEGSPIYKIAPVSICTSTLTHGDQKQLALSLLGESLPCRQESISPTPTAWALKAYPKEKWIELEERKRQLILKKLNNRKG